MMTASSAVWGAIAAGDNERLPHSGSAAVSHKYTLINGSEPIVVVVSIGLNLLFRACRTFSPVTLN